MNPTLQLEEPAVQTHDSPRLLVEWSSPRQEFLSSIKPALSRSEARLAGEAPFGLVPLRIMIPSYVLEAFVILAAIFVQIKVEELRPYVAPRLPSHEVIYYTGAELPRTEDLGGAEAGTSGRAGGDEAYHRSQTIKIARGGSLVPEVVDAPNLKLPPSHNPVANLLAVRPDAGPPPVEGMRSSRSMQNLAAVVLPAPNVVRDYTRNGAQIDSVIGPAPAVTREQPLIAPNLSAILIAPAPSVANDHQLVAPVLVPAVVPPAPRVTRERTRVAASLNVAVVAPAPKVTGDSSRAAQALTANVIPPAPTANAPEISRTPIPMIESVGRASAGVGSRARDFAHFKAHDAHASGAAAFGRYYCRCSSASRQGGSGSLANRCASAARTKRRIVHEQSDRQDLRPCGSRASAARREFPGAEWLAFA